MVEYTEWTSIVFEVADNRADATEVISWAASEWRSRKSDLKAASKRDAREYARRRV